MKCVWKRLVILFSLALGPLLSEEPFLRKLVLMGDEEGLQEIVEEAEQKFLGLPLTQEVIDEIKKHLANAYNEEGRRLVNVSAPPQEITDGVLQMQVSKSKLGEIEFCGNRWYPARQLSRYLRVEKGEEIDLQRLFEDLAWMNRNPFRRSDALFVPGKDPSSMDVKLYVWDRFPVRFWGGFDNRGNDAIGTERMFGGFNLGNLFNFDHRFSYQYTCSLSFGSLNAHTLRYEMPLPWRHEVSFFGGYSAVHLHHLGSAFKSHGHSYQISGRYVFPSQKGYVSDFTLGYDYKLTNNNLEFAEEPVFSSNVALGQFVFGYTYQSQPGCNLLFCNLELIGQPDGYMNHMTNTDYQTLRPRAKNSYIYGRGEFEFTHRFANLRGSCFTRLMGQLSSTNLLPSEEFGLGGANTVRGYKERIFNADNAILANLELKWDAFSFFRRKVECPTCCDSKEQIYERRQLGDLFSFLAFFDCGYGHVHQSTSFEPSSAYLMSAGPGVRYDFDRYIHARIDWGIQLHKIEEESYGTRLHFSVTGSY